MCWVVLIVLTEIGGIVGGEDIAHFSMEGRDMRVEGHRQVRACCMHDRRDQGQKALCNGCWKLIFNGKANLLGINK